MSNSDFLNKVANVLDIVAAQLDSVELEKIATAESARKTALNALSDKYAEATGDKLSEEVLNKLASADKDVMNFVNSLIEKQAGALEELGTPATKSDNIEPTTTKEATEKASDAFLAWILE